jgi:uncharacterized flavoprotein (TIGR03862 family)
MPTALVIGAGPAGLMAAEELACAGLSVTVADAMPSPGRKFLMAGKSGLNITKDEAPDRFRTAFHPPAPQLDAALQAFGPAEVMAFAQSLGQPVFTGSSGRVFPTAMKASPLLRAWLARLASLGVTLHTRWRWTGWDGPALRFTTPDGVHTEAPTVTILALGGASWGRLGSDGTWAAHLPGLTAPFRPANMGFQIAWSPHMTPHFGAPLKNIALIAGDTRIRGECTISARGLEGGGLYAVSRALRDGATLALDLLPDLTPDQVRARLAARRKGETLSHALRARLHLDPARLALFHEYARTAPDPAQALKHLPIPLGPPRPMDEAISTAGGLRFDALDAGLMLTSRPGTFAAGEMLDWEAPTGGYLLTACLATGRHAGRAAAAFALRQ